MQKIIRSTYVLPLKGAPIEDGALFFYDGVIAAVGRYKDLAGHSSVVEDLGDGVLFPGLINGHCHLGLTEIPMLRFEKAGFSGWAKSVIGEIASRAEGGMKTARKAGLNQLVRNCGCTTILDHEPLHDLIPGGGELEAGAEPTPQVLRSPEFGGTLAGLDTKELFSQIAGLLGKSGPAPGIPHFISPHAPYSVKPDLLGAIGSLMFSSRPEIRVSMHVAESDDEEAYFREGSGGMWDWLQSSAVSPVVPLHPSPLRHILGCGIPLEQLVLVHANFLTDDELDDVRTCRAGLVHCPSSHDFFSHTRHPVRSWMDRGLRWCLGTDSLATTHPDECGVRELDLLRECRLLKGKVPGITNRQLLESVTVRAAEVLGLDGVAGDLDSGHRADMNFLSVENLNLKRKSHLSEELAEFIIYSRPRELGMRTWIKGREVG